MRVSVNTLSTNAVRTENVDGRTFTVLNAMMIRADTSMNGILYPLEELKSTFKQMEDVPAPMGHPKLMNQHVSATNNFTKGKHDIGAFIKNVKMVGKEVFGEIWIDNEFAERSDKGRSLLQRIANKTKIGVSTGLTIANIVAKKGVDELGKAFNSVGRSFSFDHVAILEESEEAAGSHASTEIVYNSDTGESLFVINHDDGGQPESKPKVNVMKHEIDLTDLSKADRTKVMACNASDILAALTAEKPTVTVDEAQTLLESKGMKVNAADSVVLTAAEHKALKTNADLYANAEKERVDEIKESIKTNSKMTDEDLAGMEEMALTRLANSLTPSNDFSVQDGVITNANKSGKIKVDYSM